MSTPPPSASSSVPALAASDIEHAIALIQAAYSPSASSSSSTSSGGTAIQSLQSTLLSIQRTPAAWALVLPLLAHADPNVQFFGAHTAHAKIARGELSTLTPEEQEGLRRELVREAGVQGRTRVVRRKVYGAVVALAVRLVPLGAWGPPGGEDAEAASQDWIGSTVRALAAAGVRSGDIHEFLSGVAEDVGSANLLPQPRISLDASLRRAAPLVVQSVAAVLQGALSPSNTTDDDLAPALTCLAAWLPAKLLPDAELAALVPLLIALLNSQNTSDAHTERTQKIGAALSDLLARPPASWGPSVLLEPLLLWAYGTFPAFSSPDVTVPDYALRLPQGAGGKEQLKTHARLLVALADAGVEWVAGHLVDAATVQHPSGVVPRAVLAQTLVRLMLALSALDPGGARLPLSFYASEGQPHEGDAEDDDDDDDGEQQGAGPLGFWYLLQEALWEVPAANTHLFASAAHSPFPSNPSTPLPQEHDMDDDDPERFRRGSPWTPGVVRTGSYAFSGAASAPATPGADADGGGGGGAAEKTRTAHARAAYVALVRVLRAKAVCARGCARDRLERFGVYRRDVGDTIINAYYILRDDLLVYLVDEAAKGGAWETIESPLFLLRAVHEALDLDAASFSPTALPASASAPALSVGGAALDRLFGDAVWGRLPVAAGDAGAGAAAGSGAGGGQNGNGDGDGNGGTGGREAETRLRRTALGVVDTYAAYFTTRAPEALLAPLRYVLGALGDADAGVCLQISFCGVWDLRERGRGWRKSLKDSLRFAVPTVRAGLGIELVENSRVKNTHLNSQASSPQTVLSRLKASIGTCTKVHLGMRVVMVFLPSREALGKAQELLKLFRKANAAAKTRLGGSGELSLGP